MQFPKAFVNEEEKKGRREGKRMKKNRSRYVMYRYRFLC